MPNLNTITAACRAKATAQRVGAAGDGLGVAAGSFVDVHVADIAQDQAESIMERIHAAAKVGFSCLESLSAAVLIMKCSYVVI